MKPCAHVWPPTALLPLRNYNGPVLQLQNLAPEELYVLLCNIRNVFANYDKDKYLLPDEALTTFLKHCSEHIGEAYFRTPRNTIKAFVDLMSVIEQNPELKWQTLIDSVNINPESDPSLVTVPTAASDSPSPLKAASLDDDDDAEDDDDLTVFKL